MTPKINPHHFTPGSQKFQPMHRPKRYVPVLFLAGVAYRVRHDYCNPSPDGFYKTQTAAHDRAQRVRARWIRLYEAANFLSMVRNMPAELTVNGEDLHREIARMVGEVQK